MRTSWNVGLATAALEPAPSATPRTKVVLPAPSSPVRSTTSPACRRSPRSMPSRSVSAGELLTLSAKVVIARAGELGAHDFHLAVRRHLADDVEACLLDHLARADADELRLFPARQCVLEGCALGSRHVRGAQLAAH